MRASDTLLLEYAMKSHHDYFRNDVVFNICVGPSISIYISFIHEKDNPVSWMHNSALAANLRLLKLPASPNTKELERNLVFIVDRVNFIYFKRKSLEECLEELIPVLRGLFNAQIIRLLLSWLTLLQPSASLEAPGRDAGRSSALGILCGHPIWCFSVYSMVISSPRLFIQICCHKHYGLFLILILPLWSVQMWSHLDDHLRNESQ